MCGGSNRQAGKRAAEKEQERLDQQARDAQAELDRIADESNAIATQQLAESARLQKQFADQQQDQRDRVTSLEAQQDEKLLGIKNEQNRKSEELATAQAVKVGGIRSRGQAVSSSLQILGKQNLTGPSASSTKGKSVRKGAASTAAQVTRGSTRNRGPNLSI